jgi:hypothetical protein
MADEIITKDYLEKLFHYKDGFLYWKKTKGPAKAGKIAGRISTQGYYQVGINYKVYAKHRLIFLMHHGYLPIEVDHKDGNKQNNRIENLRAATSSQNSFNKPKKSTNTSGVKGVNWDKGSSQWIARCEVDKKRYFLGRFDDIKEAEKVIVQFRNQYHGSFANHN